MIKLLKKYTKKSTLFIKKDHFDTEKLFGLGIARKMFCKCYSRIIIFRHCLTTHFNIRVWKDSRETYFRRYSFKNSFEAFFQQSQVYWRENLPSFHLSFLSLPLIQAISEMHLAEYFPICSITYL